MAEQKRRLNSWIDSYLQFTDNSEPPKLYHEWTALSVIAGVLQRKARLDWGSLTFYPNLYVVLVGPSGKCRKGTAMGFGASFLYDMGIKMAAEATTRESLIRELSTATKTDSYGASGDIDIHASLTIFSQELVVFLGYDNKQLISDLTDWYDCRKRWTYRTKSMGTDEIIGVYVNLIGAITPELIQSSMPQDAIGGGLVSRMIFVYEDRKSRTVPLPFLSDEAQEIRHNLLHDLEMIHMMSGQFRVTEEYIQLWTQWYMNAEQNPPFRDARFAGYIERRPQHVKKVAMLISASERQDMIITKDHLQKAINLIERTEVKMPMVFRGYGSSATVSVMSNIMVFIEQERTTSRKEILKRFHYDLENDRQLDQLIDTLKSMGFIRTTFGGDGNTKIEFNTNFQP